MFVDHAYSLLITNQTNQNNVVEFISSMDIRNQWHIFNSSCATISSLVWNYACLVSLDCDTYRWLSGKLGICNTIVLEIPQFTTKPSIYVSLNWAPISFNNTTCSASSNHLRQMLFSIKPHGQFIEHLINYKLFLRTQETVVADVLLSASFIIINLSLLNILTSNFLQC